MAVERIAFLLLSLQASKQRSRRSSSIQLRSLLKSLQQYESPLQAPTSIVLVFLCSHYQRRLSDVALPN